MGLFEDHVDEGGDVGYVYLAVGIHVAQGAAEIDGAEDFVDKGGNVGCVHTSIAIDVAS